MWKVALVVSLPRDSMDELSPLQIAVSDLSL